ncbi:MAG TPA: 5'-3' exonuclease H3TH domain-containing protein, partial [Burkholderiaceae bacterium]|nr:5'-3' exonuclease H3TH domain-containing protein [Burkholderiaceae bacterium]
MLLVDGSSYLYRAFHALPELRSPKTGEPTGAIYGVLNMLRKLATDYKAQARVAVFDAKGRTFRDELYPQYKATRTAMPDDLSRQVEPLHDAITALGWPLLVIDGVEADDVIATLVEQARARGWHTVISTGDKDLTQLVDARTLWINTMSNEKLDVAGVTAKFGVPPEKIVDYLALIGDQIDNIPGVDKVGPKTAAKWLNAYGTLASIQEHAGEITGKVGENLRAGTETVALSRQLATIRRDVDLPVDEAALRPRAPDVAALRELYTRLEMRSFLRALDGDATAGGAVGEVAGGGAGGPSGGAGAVRTTVAVAAAGTAAAAGAAGATPALGVDPVERHYVMIDDWTVFLGWLERLRRAPLIAFDTETTGLDYMKAQIVGVSFCVEAGRGAYVPLAHGYPGAPDQLDRNRVLAALRPLLEDPDLPKVGANLKFDMHVLENHGIVLRGQRYDTMLESYVLNSVATRHDMDSMAGRYLGIATIHFEDVAGKGAKQITFDQVDVATATTYAAEDADVTLRLHQALWPQLAAVPALEKLYTGIEQPLVPVLQRMERGGVLIDRAMLRQQSIELAARLKELGAQAQREAGQEFNVESPRQLQQILFE